MDEGLSKQKRCNGCVSEGAVCGSATRGSEGLGEGKEDAGRLAENYRQVRKTELWTPALTTSARRGLLFLWSVGTHCSSGGGKKVSSSTSLKGEDVVKVEKRPKKDEKPLMCYNCGGRGHTSRQCPSDAFFCETRKSVTYRGRRKPARQPFCCEGLVEGQFVNDIVLDTGCSRTLVRGDLVRQEKLSLERTVIVQCAHGDVVVYPVATVEISVQGKVCSVEAAVSDKLPHSVLLGSDVSELVSFEEGRQGSYGCDPEPSLQAETESV